MKFILKNAMRCGLMSEEWANYKSGGDCQYDILEVS